MFCVIGNVSTIPQYAANLTPASTPAQEQPPRGPSPFPQIPDVLLDTEVDLEEKSPAMRSVTPFGVEKIHKPKPKKPNAPSPFPEIPDVALHPELIEQSTDRSMAMRPITPKFLEGETKVEEVQEMEVETKFETMETMQVEKEEKIEIKGFASVRPHTPISKFVKLSNKFKPESERVPENRFQSIAFGAGVREERMDATVSKPIAVRANAPEPPPVIKIEIDCADEPEPKLTASSPRLQAKKKSQTEEQRMEELKILNERKVKESLEVSVVARAPTPNPFGEERSKERSRPVTPYSTMRSETPIPSYLPSQLRSLSRGYIPSTPTRMHEAEVPITLDNYPVFQPNESAIPFNINPPEEMDLGAQDDVEMVEIMESPERRESIPEVKPPSKVFVKPPEAVIGARPLFGAIDVNRELSKKLGIKQKLDASETSSSKHTSEYFTKQGIPTKAPPEPRVQPSPKVSFTPVKNLQPIESIKPGLPENILYLNKNRADDDLAPYPSNNQSQRHTEESKLVATEVTRKMFHDYQRDSRQGFEPYIPMPQDTHVQAPKPYMPVLNPEPYMPMPHVEPYNSYPQANYGPVQQMEPCIPEPFSYSGNYVPGNQPQSVPKPTQFVPLQPEPFLQSEPRFGPQLVQQMAPSFQQQMTPSFQQMAPSFQQPIAESFRDRGDQNEHNVQHAVQEEIDAVKENEQTDYKKLPVRSLIKAFEESVRPIMRYKQVRDPLAELNELNSKQVPVMVEPTRSGRQELPRIAQQQVQRPQPSYQPVQPMQTYQQQVQRSEPSFQPVHQAGSLQSSLIANEKHFDQIINETLNDHFFLAETRVNSRNYYPTSKVVRPPSRARSRSPQPTKEKSEPKPKGNLLTADQAQTQNIVRTAVNEQTSQVQAQNIVRTAVNEQTSQKQSQNIVRTAVNEQTSQKSQMAVRQNATLSNQVSTIESMETSQQSIQQLTKMAQSTFHDEMDTEISSAFAKNGTRKDSIKEPVRPKTPERKDSIAANQVRRISDAIEHRERRGSIPNGNKAENIPEIIETKDLIKQIGIMDRRLSTDTKVLMKMPRRATEDEIEEEKKEAQKIIEEKEEAEAEPAVLEFKDPNASKKSTIKLRFVATTSVDSGNLHGFFIYPLAFFWILCFSDLIYITLLQDKLKDSKVKCRLFQISYLILSGSQ